MKVAMPGRVTGIGGPISFQQKLVRGLTQRNIAVTYDLDDEPYDAVLVINATRQLSRLWRCKRRGVRIVQRLGIPNWLHDYLPVRRWKRIQARVRNLMMQWIRQSLADCVVYQSCFVQNVWNKAYGATKAPSTVIYNGVDLAVFNPDGSRYQSQADVCLISVEGTQGSDPFDIAVSVAQGIEARGMTTELLIFGKPWRDAEARFACYPFVNFRGAVPNRDLPHYYRGAAIYVSTDIITAGCPNSVLEALACGAPVIGYRAGVLPELLDESSGRCVEPRGDPWKGEAPANREGMVDATLEVLAGLEHFRRGARRLAAERYGLDAMVDAYVEALSG
jgi:glycosyltransferase involved in cell wall biosynthesis